MKKNSLRFVQILFYNIILILITNLILDEERLIIENYKEIFGEENFNDILNLRKKWSWVVYAIIPLLIFIRTSLVSICLYVGLFFYDTENSVKFRQLFGVSLLGEYVLLLVGLFKLGYFYLIKTEYTLQDLQEYFPLSYINFLDIEKLEPWLIYPLQTINIFEISYFFVLVFGIHKLLKNNYMKSFEMVAVSYGSGLIIWLVMVMFLTLSMS